MNIIKWLAEWYISNCDGDWEHCYGMSIGTMDNPGWGVVIELHETELEDRIFHNISLDNGEDDWFDCKVENNVFYGYGDPHKLLSIIEIFKDFAENRHTGIDTNKSDTHDNNMGKILPRVKSWNEFAEKYISHGEQYILTYADMNIGLYQNIFECMYIVSDSRGSKFNIVESADNLIKNVIFNTGNIKELWEGDEVKIVNTRNKTPLVNTTYEEFLYNLIMHKESFTIYYGTHSYNVYYLDTHAYKQNGTVCLSGSQDSFESPKDLLERVRIFGKSIQQIVNELLS